MSSYASRLVTEGAIWAEASDSIRTGPVLDLRKRLESAERRLEAHAEAKSELEELAEQVADEERRMRQRAETETAALRHENRNLRVENDDLHARVQQLSLVGRYASGDSEESDPDDVSDDAELRDVFAALLSADDKLRGLRFLPRAYDSAEASLYKRPDEIFAAFRVLDELSSARSSGDSLGSSLEEWFLQRNVRYSPFQSRQRWGSMETNTRSLREIEPGRWRNT